MAECASSCLKNTKINGLTLDMKFKCLSFDFCPIPGESNSFKCIFNNLTTEVDPSLTTLVDDSSLCEHYSKSSMVSDSMSVLEMYNLIEQKVLKNKNDMLTFATNQNKQVIS